MSNVNNPLSPLSYTNKDFQTIYPELLEAAKMLAKNWDPTISNESDPGVVLLKLNAIIGDKNNYNIDKNILENYPETYTQEVSARSQYRQLGYKMPWYRAATAPVNFRWVGEELSLGQYVTIPRHTLLTDTEREYVFTLLDPVTIHKKDNYSTLIAEGKVMQGYINRLSIAGSDIITLSNIDAYNRLYINDTNVAENGIFVFSAGDNNRNLWTQVYNVDTQSPGELCYEFDVDQRSGYPYIQFPSDIYSLIGEGICVEYITTNGYSGNVAAGAINSYLDATTVKLESYDLTVESKNVNLNTDNIKLVNPYATSDILAHSAINIGKDPETIEEARTSYKKVVGTFDTLVTLRDYMNAIYTSDRVSNVIVTDRTNDIQCSYKIVTKHPSIFDTVTYVTTNTDKLVFKKVNKGKLYNVTGSSVSAAEEGSIPTNPYYLDEEESKDMSPFDLKLYLLKFDDVLHSSSSYDNTFTIDDSTETKDRIIANLSNVKSIQHNFVDIKKDLPFMLQVAYPIKLKIIPTYKLDEAQQLAVNKNIILALKKLLNSRNCEFGIEPNYDIIYNAIADSDDRIKIVIMDDFVYTLFAVYLGNKFGEDDQPTDELEFKYIPISDYSKCDRIIVENSKTKLESEMGKLVTLKVADDQIKEYIFIDSANGIMYKPLIEDNYLDGGERSTSRKLVKYSDKLTEIRKQVITKNILAGVTPLYDVVSDFVTTIDMIQNGVDKVLSVDTDLNISPFGIGAEYSDTNRSATYTLKANEMIRCLAPSFTTDRTFSGYTKFEITLAKPISSDSEFDYASPSDEKNIVDKFGYTQFYSKDSYGKFTPIYSDAHITPSVTPRMKLDSYYIKGNSGHETTYSVISKESKLVGTLSDIETALIETKYELPFEPNLYYTKGDKGYIPLTEYPYDKDNANNTWGKDYYSRCYKLRQYISDKCCVELGEYIDSIGGIDLGFDEITVIRDAVGGRLYSKAKGSSNAYVLVVEDEGEGASYYDALRYLEAETGEGNRTSDCSYWVDISAEISGTSADDVKVANNFNNCYIQLGKYGTDVYKVIKDGNNVLGYEMVMLNKCELLENGEYDVEVASQTAITEGAEYVLMNKSAEWATSGYSVKYFNNSADKGSIGMHFTSNITYIPDKPEVVYKNESGKYVEATDVGSNWSNEYTKYYERINQIKGLHPSSDEYIRWKNSELILYVPSLTHSIQANTEYQLRKGDSAKFFWRESDEEDAPYRYMCYKGTEGTDNPIIKADFTIEAKTPGTELVNSGRLSNSGSINYGEEDFSVVEAMYGDNDLGASRRVEIRKINQVVMSKTVNGSKNIYYYLVTNNKIVPKEGPLLGKLCYKLSLDKVSSSDTSYRYKHILQADEYFFYVNEKQTLHGVVGEGTLIDYVTSEDMGDTWDLIVEAVDSFEISFKGISAFKTYCNEISSTDTIKLIEQQVYSFTAGDSLRFDLKPNCTEEFVPATSYSEEDTYYCYTAEYEQVTPLLVDGKTIIPTFVPYYYYEKDGSGVYTKLSEEPSDWRDDSFVGAVRVYGCSSYYYEKSGNYSEVEDQTDVTNSNYQNYFVKSIPAYPVISTTNPTELSSVDVHYSTTGSISGDFNNADKVYTQLPRINVTDSEYKWSVFAYLNLHISPTEPQVIPGRDDKNQSMCSVSIGDTEFSSDTSDKDLYLMSDVIIDKTGGKNTDISWKNLVGETQSVEILSYYLNDSFESDENFKKLLDKNEIEYHIGKGSNPPTVGNFEIKNLSFDNRCLNILPIELMTDDLIVYVDVSSNNGNTHSACGCKCCGNVLISTQGKHFLPIPKGTNSIKVSFQNTSTEHESAIKFHKIFKHKLRDIFDKKVKYGITTDMIESEIRDLDVKKEFNYCYVTDESSHILDPLDPVSVFDGNHVFNKFSIPRAELRTTEPYSTVIEFVNNR